MQRDFIFLYFLIRHMETLVQIPIVMHFCNLSSCSLVHSYHLEMSYRENFPLFLLTYLLLRFFFFLLFHWISHINCFLSLSRYFKTCPQRFLVVFFFLKRPCPASDLASFCSHTFNFSYQFLPSCPLCLKETFYKCLQSHFIVSHYVSV